MNNKIYIKVEAIVPDDVDQFEGADIDDFDRVNCVAKLFVDPEEIDAQYIVFNTSDSNEFWGQVFDEPTDVLMNASCMWHGRSIINAEDVCWALEETLG
jgi:hypothetical protein